jgi:hypothetical protein
MWKMLADKTNLKPNAWNSVASKAKKPASPRPAMPRTPPYPLDEV